MVYPSGYRLGIPGVRNPVLNPYEIVKESVRLTRQRSQNPRCAGAAVAQDFKDYAFDKRIFGPGEVRAQIRGSDDGGGSGWMLWNPKNAYRAPRSVPRPAPSPTRPSRHARGAVGGPARYPPGCRRAGGRPAPAREANELGRVMILEYHKIDTPEARWTRTPENFRRDLQRLWERGYRTVALNDYLDGKMPSRRAPRRSS